LPGSPLRRSMVYRTLTRSISFQRRIDPLMPSRS
jgi:hypothetical protein